MTVTIKVGDVLEQLATLPDESVHCVVTSPPYWRLRDYGMAGQIGLETTPQEFVDKLVAVFREVRRVLRADGTCWVNMGDSYAGSRGCGAPSEASTLRGNGHVGGGPKIAGMTASRRRDDEPVPRSDIAIAGLKPKDLVGMPWRLAFALQDDGWWLRQDIIWHKLNPMPESVRDRCTKAHEYVFLLSKSERYYFDIEAMQEPARVPEGSGNASDNRYIKRAETDPRMRTKAGLAKIGPRDIRNKRSVWTITTKGFSEAHVATFPPELPETCIKAGCPEGGTVLDPFFGAGTTGLVADRLGRDCIGIELNPAYADMARRRIQADAPLLADVSSSA